MIYVLSTKGLVHLWKCFQSTQLLYSVNGGVFNPAIGVL